MTNKEKRIAWCVVCCVTGIPGIVKYVVLLAGRFWRRPIVWKTILALQVHPSYSLEIISCVHAGERPVALCQRWGL